MDSPTIIWGADGSLTDLTALKIDKRVREYDSNLRFGYNPENRDYILYVVMPNNFDAFYIIDGEKVYPIIGFGPQVPSEDAVLKRLYSADVRRRGMDVYNQLMKHNEELKAKNDLKAAENVEEAALRIEHLARKAGRTEKYGKVFMAVPKSRKH